MTISEYLNELKKEKALTNQQIAELSGIAPGTVARLFSGHAEGAAFYTVSSVVKVLGGSLDELAGIEQKQIEPTTGAATVIKYVRDYETEKRISEIYLRSLRDKNLWIIFLGFLLFALIAAIIGILIYDFTHIDIGFFRQALASVEMQKEILITII